MLRQCSIKELRWWSVKGETGKPEQPPNHGLATVSKEEDSQWFTFVGGSCSAHKLVESICTTSTQPELTEIIWQNRPYNPTQRHITLSLTIDNCHVASPCVFFHGFLGRCGCPQAHNCLLYMQTGHVGPCGAMRGRLQDTHATYRSIFHIIDIWWYLFSRTVWIRMVNSQEPQINFNHWGSRDSDTKLLYMLAESYGTSLSHTKPKCWFPVIFSRLLLGSCLASEVTQTPTLRSAWFPWVVHTPPGSPRATASIASTANFVKPATWHTSEGFCLPIPPAKSQLFPPDRKATNPHRAELDPRRPKGET